MNKAEPKMYAIKKPAYCGSNPEGEYATREEAQAALDKMHDKAIADTKEREKWLAEHPQPWNPQDQTHAWINGYDKAETPLDIFNERKWYVAEIPATRFVYRLNTLPADSPALVKEIEAKMALFHDCELSWTCHGHTRSQWQSEAAAAQLKAMHPEWKVVNSGYEVEISA